METMALTTEYTSFTLDNMGRYLCNTLQEALHSTGQQDVGLGTPPKDGRPFDVIVIGGGSFGSAIAQHLFFNDATRSRRILVLEQGPFVAPEHQQNLPFVGGIAPGMYEPWVSNLAPLQNVHKGGFSGLLYGIGGRSLTWGGWSPELLDDEWRDWPAAVRADLRGGYFEQSSDQIGVTDTNDFIYGPLHTAMRGQLHAALKAGIPHALPFVDWLDHPQVRFHIPAITDAQLLALLGDPAPHPIPPRQDLLNLLKLEAPLAVQSRAEPGVFPTNKFSSVPLLIQAARQAANESQPYDELKRLMIVPKSRVLELVTQTLPDNSVRVIGVRVANNPFGDFIRLADGGVVIIALGTIESSRLTLLTFQQSLAGRAAQRIGTNLMAHLRSNLTIRVPVAALGNPFAGVIPEVVPVSALFVKGQANVGGQNRYFHIQITASGGRTTDISSEAALFKKIPDLDDLEKLRLAAVTHVIIGLRGIGEMVPNNPASRVQLAQFDWDPPGDPQARPAAWVTIGDARAYAEAVALMLAAGQPPPPPPSPETQLDTELWDVMDSFCDELATVFANGQPFEILGNGRTIPIPAGTPANLLRNFYPYTGSDRRDGLGTTHHEAGTMRMGDVVANSVTDVFGKLHDTPNCFFAGPSLFPTIGSPNPMLTGIALARRTADLLSGNHPVVPTPAGLLPRPAPFVGDGPGWTVLFDGTLPSFQHWRRVGGNQGGANQPPCGFQYIDGQIITIGTGDHALLYFPQQRFGDFILKLQFRVFDPNSHNSGVFVRFQNPLQDLQGVLQQQADADGRPWRTNRAWTAVYSGFELQIDDNAKPNPPGLRRHRTGAIYNIPAGDPGEAVVQTYQPGPALTINDWFEYEIRVQGQQYDVFLGRADGSPKVRTTHFVNGDALRGVSAAGGADSGYVGVQAHFDGRVAFRHIQIRP
jgi:hypothetical protein